MGGEGGEREEEAVVLVESLALLGSGAEAKGEGSCMRGHMQGTGDGGRPCCIFSLAHPPAGYSHMKGLRKPAEAQPSHRMIQIFTV